MTLDAARPRGVNSEACGYVHSSNNRMERPPAMRVVSCARLPYNYPCAFLAVERGAAHSER